MFGSLEFTFTFKHSRKKEKLVLSFLLYARILSNNVGSRTFNSIRFRRFLKPSESIRLHNTGSRSLLSIVIRYFDRRYHHHYYYDFFNVQSSSTSDENILFYLTSLPINNRIPKSRRESKIFAGSPKNGTESRRNPTGESVN